MIITLKAKVLSLLVFLCSLLLLALHFLNFVSSSPLFLHPFFLSWPLLLSSLMSVNYTPTLLLLLILFSLLMLCVYRDNSVGVVIRLLTGNPRNPVSIPNSGKSFFSFPNIPDRLQGQISLVLSGCRERFPRGNGKKGLKLTTHSIFLTLIAFTGTKFPLLISCSFIVNFPYLPLSPPTPNSSSSSFVSFILHPTPYSSTGLRLTSHNLPKINLNAILFTAGCVTHAVHTIRLCVLVTISSTASPFC